MSFVLMRYYKNKFAGFHKSANEWVTWGEYARHFESHDEAFKEEDRISYTPEDRFTIIDTQHLNPSLYYKEELPRSQQEDEVGDIKFRFEKEDPDD